MKKLLTISLTLLFSGFINAQGSTLQFNNAFYHELDYSTQTFTVPANQVCKITNITMQYNGTSGNVRMRLPGGGSNDWAYVKFGGTNVGGYFAPIWLPAGDYEFYCSNSGAMLSGIFFNLIPVP
tara:strand:- start:1058 stop:1429 length:372 start_codon:yes stop_codon:yes gene_type:complete